MKKESRIILARQLVQCAKMILDTGQFNENKNMNKIDRMRQASTSTKIRKIILEYDQSGLKQDAKKGNAFASANVFHHMRGEKKYIGVDSINGKKIQGNVFDEYRCALGLTSSDQQKNSLAKIEFSSDKYNAEQKKEIKEMAKYIRTEIKNCILISSEFHDWLTHRIKNDSLTFRKKYPLKTREDYYKLYHNFTKDKTCLNKVTKCHFEGDGLINAIQSFSRLKGCINDHLILFLNQTQTNKKSVLYYIIN